MDVETKLDNVAITDDEIITQVAEEYKNAIEFRKARIAEWHANEDMLYGKKPPTLSKRSNIDLRLMAGFNDTLLSKINKPPTVKYGHTEEADLFKARKVTALWELESSPTRQNWKFKDLLSKKLALVPGRAIDKIFTISPYKHYREIVDHYDFLIDPLTGGLDIENARYLGQDNIFKSKYDLSNNKSYNKDKVQELINSYSEKTTAEVDNEYKEKANRFGILGLNSSLYNAQKDGLFKLLEWYTTINGQRWYVLCDLSKKIIVKRKPLEEIFGIYEEGGKPLWPFSSWAYFPDAFNFWSISPMDLVRDNFQTRNVTICQAVDNNEAKNKPMKSYDPSVYKYPEKLKYTPDGLVPVAKGKNPANGLYVHQTPNIIDPKILNEILEDVAAKVTGVTPAGQGVAQGDQKVGIYYGNQSEVAERMVLFDESYTNAQSRMALLYLNGLKDHLDEEKAVKMIGEQGVTWDKLKKEDLGEFDITITGGSIQANLDAMKAKQKADFITRNAKNTVFNQKALAEQDALNSGFTPQEVKKLLDTQDGSEEMLAMASEDIQKLLKGDIRPNQKADTTYARHILEFYGENELTPEQDKRFQTYLDAIQDIVIQNMVNKANSEVALKGALPTPDMGLPADAPQPNTPGATISMASQVPNSISQPNVQ
ncbi:MAG: hypothetical protein CSYNP_03117 [Syntrophus sp. SKADARSKE-3]|nr:hypothetical protein [Syntrophus sp. SKADARSKE-3]